MGSRPRLRYLDFFPLEQDGRPLVALCDPFQISQATLAVSPDLVALLSLFDGNHTLEEIYKQWSPQSDHPLSLQELEGLVAQLDEACFLDNERFLNQRRALLEDFLSSPVRPAFHAATSYPEQPLALCETLTSYYTASEGAGLPSGNGPPLKALVAPHIDPRLGGPVYTHAYRALGESRPASVFLILGTAHTGLPHLFSVSGRDFETPLGRVRTDQEFVRHFRSRLSPGLFAEDLAHRHEHTIEFQLIFLQHLLGDHFSIVPVLCGFSWQEVEPGERGRELLESFLEATRGALESASGPVCLIASVDLAHIGPRYGDPTPPGPETVEKTLQRDREMLEFVIRGEPEGFQAFIREEGDRRRICGFAPLLALLRLTQGSRGRLLCHRQSRMDPAGSFVSYASLVLEETGPRLNRD